MADFLGIEQSRKLSVNPIHVGIVAVAAPLCFVPCMIGATDLNYTYFASCLRLENGVSPGDITNGPLLQIAAMAGAVLVPFPILIDQYLDFLCGYSLSDICERLLLVVTVTLLGLVFLFARNNIMYVTTFISFFYWQKVLWGFTVLSTLCRMSPEVWDVKRTSLILLLGTVAQVIDSNNSFGKSGDVFTYIGYLLNVVGFGIYMFYLFVWTRGLVASKKGLGWASSLSAFTVEESYSAIYMYSFAFVVLFHYTFWACTGFHGWSDSGYSFVTSYVLLQVLFTIVLTVFPGRIARSRVQHLQRDLESKKSWVRHMSHVVRSPLSVIQHGIELVENGKATEDIDIFGFMRSACFEIVSVLNENDMQSGVFSIACRPVNVLHFIKR